VAVFIPIYRGAAAVRKRAMLKIGDKAPDFTLQSEAGADVTLKDFKGKRVVLFFFPKASTPG
jgi:peroxiredoxin Q/BCP